MAAKTVRIGSASVTAETPFGLIKVAWPRIDPKNKRSARVVKLMVLPSGQDEARLLSETLADFQKKAAALIPLLIQQVNPNQQTPGEMLPLVLDASKVKDLQGFLMDVCRTKAGPAA